MKPAMSISAAAAQQTSADSLYKRLGGCDAITAVTDDFIGRLGTDPLSPGSFRSQHRLQTAPPFDRLVPT
jgi:hypothetical protein